MTTAEWSILYRQHIETVRSRVDTALGRAGLDHLVVPSGTLHYQVFDDRDYPFAT
jgi:Xaa-Pro dipeptidase